MEKTKEIEVRIRRCWIFGLISLLVGHLNGGEGVSARASQDSNGVEITRFMVPPSIENGSVAYVDLDCEYTLQDNVTELLVVTWYHNDSKVEKIVYKWIPGHNIQRAYGLLEKRLDLNYVVSDVPWEKHRGLRILKPTTEVSGKYRCDVSTKNGHKTEGSLLIVYSKPTEYDLEVKQGENDTTVNVSCWARRTYPKAKLTISFEQDKNHNKKLTDMNEESSWASGAYDIRVFGVIDRDILPKSTIITCDIKIPNTSYWKRKEVKLSGHGTQDELSRSTSSRIGGAIFIIILIHIWT